MQPRQYASLLRQFRSLERRRNRSYEEQAVEVLRLRLETIDRMDEPDAVKEALSRQAQSQWEVWMERPLPEVR